MYSIQENMYSPSTWIELNASFLFKISIGLIVVICIQFYKTYKRMWHHLHNGKTFLINMYKYNWMQILDSQQTSLVEYDFLMWMLYWPSQWAQSVYNTTKQSLQSHLQYFSFKCTKNSKKCTVCWHKCGENIEIIQDSFL